MYLNLHDKIFVVTDTSHRSHGRGGTTYKLEVRDVQSNGKGLERFASGYGLDGGFHAFWFELEVEF